VPAFFPFEYVASLILARPALAGDPARKPDDEHWSVYQATP
jgi:hypothetical protein